jgi:hypothetical protein
MFENKSRKDNLFILKDKKKNLIYIKKQKEKLVFFTYFFKIFEKKLNGFLNKSCN